MRLACLFRLMRRVLLEVLLEYNTCQIPVITLTVHLVAFGGLLAFTFAPKVVNHNSLVSTTKVNVSSTGECKKLLLFSDAGPKKPYPCVKQVRVAQQGHTH